MAMRHATSELGQLKNSGATIEQRLNEIGVFSRVDLAKLGPVKSFRRIKENHPDKTIPVCYYLYSLQGALDNVHWDALPAKLKADLRKQVAGAK
jgi:DNA transformation protein and related proteins